MSETETRMTPEEVWTRMLEGNRRFVAGEPLHPRQDVDRRHELAAGQTPHTALFGCSDSRLSAEIIFDQGLGDLFVIRNAGQVISDSVIGSIEYAVAVLGVPLIIVLGHDACGAVRAAIDSTAPEATPLPPHIWRQVAPIVPAVRRVQAVDGSSAGQVDPDHVGREHLRDTVNELLHSSELVSQAVADGALAIAAVNYRLSEGTAVPDFIVGVAESPAS
ncbi:carbonic anhydrase [Microbacterium sp. SORGH_AS_0888]|uniref:carbonic anhydrase n=1 Tax=Microbacterium sp. SORGH_AS_0888 TaxID=3041791 RepID=UPI002783145A|nr:carbonic anhydrase [Microbacterium sp. SORGH_AS_0888]MDQ1128125.1 carbonic anhydrase [Microbacterium sp. SORGH_AS_0888]